jgi:hypothetical protein
LKLRFDEIFAKTVLNLSALPPKFTSNPGTRCPTIESMPYD